MLCKYPKVGYKQDIPSTTRKEAGKEEKTDPSIQIPCQKVPLVVAYVQGICESLKNICGKHGVTVHFKGGQTLENILMSPKDKDSMTKSSVIYSYSCGRIDCDEEYIGESSRTFGKRFKEYLKAPSPIYDHQNNSGHKTTMENFKIIERGEQHG